MQTEEEISWLNRQIDDFETALRRGSWQLEQLEDTRAKLRSIWDDICASEMSRRFFDPHGEGSAREVADLKHGENQLREVSQAVAQCNQELAHAGHLSHDFRMLHAETNIIFSAIDSLVSEALERAGESLGHSRDAHNLIVEANGAGNSAPQE